MMMASLARSTVVYLLLASTSCICQQVPRSCGIVKEALRPIGTVLDSFTPGSNLQCKLNQTCCSSQLEDSLMESNKYKQRSLFLSLLNHSMYSCFSDETFQSSAAEVISSTEIELVNLISTTYNQYFAPYNNIFSDFYTYLAEIPFTLDMCALKGEVEQLLFKVYRATLANFASNELLNQPESYQNCLFDFFLNEKSRDIHQFYKQFEKSFARFWYFMRSRKVLIDVMNELVKHIQFTDSCNAALLHATDCAKCSGYANIQVCNDFCVNLFRGCLIDFKEVGIAYDSLHTALKSLEHQMKTSFNPDRALESFQSLFLHFISSSAAPGEISKITTECGPFQGVAELPTSGVSKRAVESEVTLVQLAQSQMTCFDKLHNLFDNIESTMCEANNATTNNNNNTNCWNGQEFGSYNDRVLDANRIQQQQNKEIIVSSSPSVVITQLREILEATARDIRYLLIEEFCDPDDEDSKCVQPDDYCNIPIMPVVEVEYSGSGEPPTISFGKPNVEVNITTNTTIMVSPTKSSTTISVTVSKSQIVPHETNTPTTPSRPTGPTSSPKWSPTADPDDQVAGASSIHQSLCLLLLLTATVVFCGNTYLLP